VVWEVLSRELPWARTPPRAMLGQVLMGARPTFHAGAPEGIVDIARACWAEDPQERPTFDAILADMKAAGCWADEGISKR